MTKVVDLFTLQCSWWRARIVLAPGAPSVLDVVDDCLAGALSSRNISTTTHLVTSPIPVSPFFETLVQPKTFS